MNTNYNRGHSEQMARERALDRTESRRRLRLQVAFAAAWLLAGYLLAHLTGCAYGEGGVMCYRVTDASTDLVPCVVDLDRGSCSVQELLLEPGGVEVWGWVERECVVTAWIYE